MWSWKISSGQGGQQKVSPALSRAGLAAQPCFSVLPMDGMWSMVGVLGICNKGRGRWEKEEVKALLSGLVICKH